MADVKQPIEAAPEVSGRRRNLGFTVRTITPAVYLTGNYNSKSSAKAAELTRLLSGLFSLGIWKSTEEAFNNGIAAGTFILVDDEQDDLQVQVVTGVRKK